MRRLLSGLTPRRIFTLVVLTGLLVVVIIAAPAIWSSAVKLRDVNPVWTVIAAVLELRAIGAYARLQRRLLRVGGTAVPMRQMLALTYAGNALNATLPGGIVAADGYSIARFRERGATITAAVFTVTMSSALSLVAFLFLSVSTGLSDSNTSTLILTGLGAVIVGAICWYGRRNPDRAWNAVHRIVRVINRLLRRDAGNLRDKVTQIRKEMRSISMNRRDWLLAGAMALVNWLADCAALYACCRAAGVDASPTLVLTAYVLGMGAASISMLPGGLGPADVAMVVVLRHGAGGAGAATSAVLLYRFLTLGLVVGLGWVAWGLIQLRGRRRPAPHEADVSAVSTGSRKSTPAAQAADVV